MFKSQIIELEASILIAVTFFLIKDLTYRLIRDTYPRLIVLRILFTT